MPTIHGARAHCQTVACRALSSAGERSLHTGEVVGSIPTAPTIKSPVKSAFTAPRRFGPLGSFGQNKAGNDASTRGKSVDFVPHLFSRKKATKNPRQVVPTSLQ